MKRTVGIAAWDERVSTTLDFAGRLVVVVVTGGREIFRQDVPLIDEPVEAKARRIRDLAVRVVLCGAVSEPLARAVCRAGIQVIPFVGGEVDMVLAAYLCGRLAEPRFLQPGSPPGVRRRWWHRGGFRGDLKECW
ncbi:MAG: NifB/NifX family molybdenum-iron cluster-binding protein [Planctomycetota bacterium]